MWGSRYEFDAHPTDCENLRDFSILSETLPDKYQMFADAPRAYPKVPDYFPEQFREYRGVGDVESHASIASSFTPYANLHRDSMELRKTAPPLVGPR